MNDKDFIINVGPGGTFQRSGQYQTIPDDIDQIFNNYEQNQTKKIAIFIHGGLVNESSGLDTARRLSPELLEAGCAPICFVWETGLFETISNNITKIGHTTFFQETLKYILKKTIQKIGNENLFARGSIINLEENYIDNELEKPKPFEEYDDLFKSVKSRNTTNLESLEAQETINQLEHILIRETQSDLQNNSFYFDKLESLNISTLNNDNERGSRGLFSSTALIINIGQVIYKIILRFINKTDHGFYPTVVEELLRKFFIAEAGALVWNAMKEKSNEMWQNNIGRIGNQMFVGGYFIQKLSEYLMKFPDTKINLIGHSAGSIAICNLFKQTALDINSIKFDNIIFMAPACRTELFESTILSSIERFNKLRIFTMSDEFECRDAMIPFFYTRSLLYLISGILEEDGKANDATILGLERHIKYIHPYDTTALQLVHNYLYEATKERLCFSSTADNSEEGMRTQSLKHGNFNQDALTISSIKFLIKD